MLAAATVWALLLILYAAKWLWARGDALREIADPVQCCFVGLVGVSTSLMAVAVLPYSRAAAEIAFAAGAFLTLGFAVWRTGGLWQGGRDHAATTPVLYLPTVSAALATFGKAVRQSVDGADAAGDKGTSDMYTEISRGTDQWLWFVEAHLQADVGT